MERIFETIIVGAGPGGLAAGRYLEDALILEKKEEIGKPVQCGEALDKKALKREEIKIEPAWISTIIDTTQFIPPNGKIINFFTKEGSYILDRIGFERFLASQSKAEIKLKSRVVDLERENAIWKVKTEDGKTFKSKYLIGADGPHSIIRRKVFKEKIDIFPLIEYLVELEKEIDISAIKIYFDKEKFSIGYAWIFPKSKASANIGLGFIGKGNLQEKFKDFLEKVVKKDYGNYKLLKNKSGVAPWGEVKIKLFKENAFLVGDAGGLVSPIFGGGMGNALLSGRLAAQSILNGKVESYEQKIKSLPFFNKDLFSAQNILYSFSNQVFNELGEILEKKGEDIFYLKNFSAISDFLSKPNLRKNIFKLLKLLFIYKKNIKYWL